MLLVVKLADFSRPQAGNAGHFQQARREFRAQLFVIGKMPGLDELRDFICQCLANALELPNLPGFDHVCDVFRQAFDHPRAVLVGPDFKRIFAFELEQKSDILQDADDFLFVHKLFWFRLCRVEETNIEDGNCRKMCGIFNSGMRKNTIIRQRGKEIMLKCVPSQVMQVGCLQQPNSPEFRFPGLPAFQAPR